jgi:hypothetical protein
LVEDVPILIRGGKLLHVLESTQIHPQSARILEKELWMRATGNESSGFFLI